MNNGTLNYSLLPYLNYSLHFVCILNAYRGTFIMLRDEIVCTNQYAVRNISVTLRTVGNAATLEM